MPHKTFVKQLSTLIGALIFAASGHAQIKIPYSVDTFGLSVTHPVSTDKQRQLLTQVQQRLNEHTITPQDVRFVTSDLLIDADLQQHAQIFKEFQPIGNWVSGYLYFKLSRTDENGHTKHVRYYTELPHLPSGLRFSEELKFQLEPIYSQADLQEIAPDLTPEFSANITYTPNVEDNHVISLICEIQSKELPSLETEFSTLSEQLIDLGGLSVKQDGVQTSAQWQCRLLSTTRDPDRETFKQQVQQHLNQAPLTPTNQEDAELKKFFTQAGVNFPATPRGRILFDGNKSSYGCLPKK